MEGNLYVCIMFEQKVSAFIQEKRLFGKSDKVLVALSGGADSVALLRVLLRLGYHCEAAHCNFHLRGEESVRDEKFVVSLAEDLGVKLHKADFDTAGYAFDKGISVEMAARDLRYAWFARVSEAVDAKVVAVAHHRNDSVETFLMNLVRGTGIDGLLGIRAVNGKVVRPLLCVDREDILDYLKYLGQDYVTDSTNLQSEFTRNKLRLEVIPLLESVNPSVVESISRTASRLEEVAEVYHRAVAEAAERVLAGENMLDGAVLLREPAPRSVLHEVLYPLGVNASQLDDIFCCLRLGESGRMFETSGYVLVTDHGNLRWRVRQEDERMFVLRHEIILTEDPFDVPKDRAVAYLDADKAGDELLLRKWRSGDKFVPFGMKGFKSVRNYLRDCKKSLFDKERQMVVCAGKDIVWLVGERADNRFRVTPETRRILKMWVELG